MLCINNLKYVKNGVKESSVLKYNMYVRQLVLDEVERDHILNDLNDSSVLRDYRIGKYQNVRVLKTKFLIMILLSPVGEKLSLNKYKRTFYSIKQ